MPNIKDLRFAVAATKSKVSSSSLSNARMAGESGPASSCACWRRALSRWRLKQWARVHQFQAMRLIPIAKYEKVLLLGPRTMISLIYGCVEVLGVLHYFIKIKCFRRYSCLPHIFHASQPVDIFCENFIKDLAREIIWAHGFANFLQSLRFPSKILNFNTCNVISQEARIKVILCEIIPLSESSEWSNSGVSSSLIPNISLFRHKDFSDKVGHQLLREQVALSPNYTVDGLTWSTPDSTDGETLRQRFWIAIVALGCALLS